MTDEQLLRYFAGSEEQITKAADLCAAFVRLQLTSVPLSAALMDCEPKTDAPEAQLHERDRRGKHRDASNHFNRLVASENPYDG